MTYALPILLMRGEHRNNGTRIQTGTDAIADGQEWGLIPAPVVMLSAGLA